MEKATALNKFFISQSQQSIDKTTCTTPDINTTPDISHTLNTIAATVEEIEKLLCSLDTGKSPGFDNIPTRLLKETAKEISPSLTSLYNLSFRTGEIPQDWKDATITPIPKSGNPYHPTNYRPISLLSIISKTQEKNSPLSSVQSHSTALTLQPIRLQETRRDRTATRTDRPPDVHSKGCREACCNVFLRSQ